MINVNKINQSSKNYQLLHQPALSCMHYMREQADVRADNFYVFASILQSEDHVSDWHAVNTMCKVIKSQLANIKPLTATANRHRLSTLFAMLDMPRKERQLFYKNMGHSQDINECRYQVPPAITKLTPDTW